MGKQRRAVRMHSPSFQPSIQILYSRPSPSLSCSCSSSPSCSPACSRNDAVSWGITERREYGSLVPSGTIMCEIEISRLVFRAGTSISQQAWAGYSIGYQSASVLKKVIHIFPAIRVHRLVHSHLRSDVRVVRPTTTALPREVGWFLEKKTIKTIMKRCDDVQASQCPARRGVW